MKRLSFVLLIWMLTVSTWADVTFETLDVDKRIVRLQYELDDRQAGNQTFYFPERGFVHDGDRESFRVEAVLDPERQEHLDFWIEYMPDTGYPRLKIRYNRPIQPGKSQPLRIIVHTVVSKQDIYIDAMNRLVLSYETSHPITFVMPKGFMLAETNQPVWMYEKDDRFFIAQRDTKLRVNTLRLRPLPKSD